MLIAIAHCLKESEQTKRLAAWLAELGPYPNHRLLVGRDSKAEPNLFANSGFGSIKEIEITGDAWNHWPESCNNAFRQIVKYIEFTTKEFWLWIEADCVPLKKDWPTPIEEEYQAALKNRKVFLGDFVHINEPGFIDHMSGVAVYPGRFSHHAGDAVLAHEMAWDVIGASQIIPQMQRSHLILHRWKYPAFDSWEQVEERIFKVKPNCVLFHSDKSGSLIPLLREKSGGVTETIDQSPVVPKWTDTEAEKQLAAIKETMAQYPLGFPPKPAQPFSCDIFIKTYPPDWPWFTYCLCSCLKFATGFRQIYVLAGAPNHEGMQLKKPEGVGPNWHETPTTIDFSMEYGLAEPNPDGYLIQQIYKLNADKYSDADYILFMDSDCIFTEPVTPETFMRDGKIMWLMTPFDKVRQDQREAWMPVMTKWLGKVPEFEFMFRHPFMFPRWLFEKMRGFCANQHGVTLDEYIMKQGGRAFSEFNCAGFLAHEHFRDRFEWINTAVDEVPPATILQKWSYGGLTPEIKAEFEEILKGGDVAWANNALAIPTATEAEEPIHNASCTVLTQSCVNSSNAALTSEPERAAEIISAVKQWSAITL